MASRPDERPEWVVTLEVAGRARLAVRASSPSEALKLSERRVEPGDVVELRSVYAVLAIGKREARAELLADLTAGIPERPSEGLDRARPA